MDYFDADLAKCRWRTQVPIWNGRQMSIRNPLELTVAYTRACPSFDKTVFYVSSAVEMFKLV